ncbi:bifunctional folylpolyglutamate synthase/dihydrofolate synthase [Candidatus Woesearchaeota archaeon]|nr:bifunctional folylpolyglutamate synthase/dihydrofolate synthase [Candidatus Woesearchaeota archaeon]
MNYKEAIAYLNSHDINKIDLGLDDIKKLLETLDNPPTKFRSIHVAGTNGKGSVSAMVAAILQKTGHKVGLYTSPHLIRFNERIKINNANISDLKIARLTEKIKPIAEKINGITYFELTTALAFLYFAEQKVDYAVIEVGLGGRLDATNILPAENCAATAITNISLEHKNYLGDTIKKIAFEKAGIIKEHIPIVTAASGEALEVIRKIADEKHSRLIIAEPMEYECSLQGEFQKYNIGIAAEIAYLLNINEDIIREAFKEVTWPARLEFLKHNLLVDCAHNPGASLMLANELQKAKEDTKNHYERARRIPYFRKLILVIGILKDKDYKQILKHLAPLAAKIILCKPNTERALGPEMLAAELQKEHAKDYVIIDDVKEAVIYAQETAQKNDLVLVTGSFYVVGEVYGMYKKTGIKKITRRKKLIAIISKMRLITKSL